MSIIMSTCKSKQPNLLCLFDQALLDFSALEFQFEMSQNTKNNALHLCTSNTLNFETI